MHSHPSNVFSCCRFLLITTHRIPRDGLYCLSLIRSQQKLHQHQHQHLCTLSVSGWYDLGVCSGSMRSYFLALAPCCGGAVSSGGHSNKPVAKFPGCTTPHSGKHTPEFPAGSKASPWSGQSSSLSLSYFILYSFVSTSSSPIGFVARRNECKFFGSTIVLYDS